VTEETQLRIIKHVWIRLERLCKASVYILLYACNHTRPYQTIPDYLQRFSRTWILDNFMKICQSMSVDVHFSCRLHSVSANICGIKIIWSKILFTILKTQFVFCSFSRRS
jgi:hypothetical protein